jgi:hypothetical protein
MQAAAVDRIHQRLALTRGGTATAAGVLRWEVALPEDPEADDGPILRFHNALKLEDGRVTTIDCDARLDRYTADQAGIVASFQAALATALRREGVVFASFADVAAFLEAEVGARMEEGAIEIAPEAEDVEPVFVSEAPVAREPWVNLSTAFVDDVDPEWLLEQNGLLTHLRFESFEGDVSLSSALPLADLTGQRLIELVDDLFSFRERLLDELEGGDEDEEDEDEEDD